MLYHIFTADSPQGSWNSRLLDEEDEIVGDFIVGKGIVRATKPSDFARIPNECSFLKSCDKSMYCSKGRLYQTMDGKSFERVGTDVHCGIKMFSCLGGNRFVLLLNSGFVRFGRIDENFFHSSPCNYEDQINQFAPMDLARFNGNFDDHCCSIVTREGRAIFLLGSFRKNLWEGEIVASNIPLVVIFADRIGGVFTVIAAERWTVKTHSSLREKTKHQYHRLLLSFRQIGLNFVLFLQVAELI